MSDFDEGKRSCRRKLERHNTRRRRKPTADSGGATHSELLQPVAENEENNYDVEAGKGLLFSIPYYYAMLIVSKSPLSVVFFI